jgi:hypothetical protein
LLVSTTQQTPLICVYLPPGDTTELEYLTEALNRFPNQQPIVIGDLSTDLEDLSQTRTMETNNLLASYGLINMIAQFQQRRKHRNCKTWLHMRNDPLIESRCNYILGTDKQLFKSVQICTPRHYTSDHRMVLAKYMAETPKAHKKYLNEWQKFLIPEPPRPLTLHNFHFKELQRQCPPCPKRAKAAMKSWILPQTIKLLNTRCALRRHKYYDKAEGRRLTRLIKIAIHDNQKKKNRGSRTRNQESTEQQVL